MDLNEIKFEQYKILSEQVQRRDDLYWLFFGIFIVANTILLVGTILGFDYLQIVSRFVLALFGLATSIVWLFVSGRCIYHRDSLITKALEIEKSFVINDKHVLDVWDKTKRIKPRSFIEKCSATYISVMAIIGITLFWLITLVYTLIYDLL